MVSVLSGAALPGSGWAAPSVVPGGKLEARRTAASPPDPACGWPASGAGQEGAGGPDPERAAQPGCQLAQQVRERVQALAPASYNSGDRRPGGEGAGGRGGRRGRTSVADPRLTFSLRTKAGRNRAAT